MESPVRLHLDREKGLEVEWPGGQTVLYPIAWLRRMSPSAEQRQLREEMSRNPLTVLPSSHAGRADKPLTAESAELVGSYAIRIKFSDGHDTGIYSWQYLREIDPSRAEKA